LLLWTSDPEAQEIRQHVTGDRAVGIVGNNNEVHQVIDQHVEVNQIYAVTPELWDAFSIKERQIADARSQVRHQRAQIAALKERLDRGNAEQQAELERMQNELAATERAVEELSEAKRQLLEVVVGLQLEITRLQKEGKKPIEEAQRALRDGDIDETKVLLYRARRYEKGESMANHAWGGFCSDGALGWGGGCGGLAVDQLIPITDPFKGLGLALSIGVHASAGSARFTGEGNGFLLNLLSDVGMRLRTSAPKGLIFGAHYLPGWSLQHGDGNWAYRWVGASVEYDWGVNALGLLYILAPWDHHPLQMFGISLKGFSR
jgi:hypothetical protein